MLPSREGPSWPGPFPPGTSAVCRAQWEPGARGAEVRGHSPVCPSLPAHLCDHRRVQVGVQAHQEAHPLHRPQPGLAPQQCAAGRRLLRLQMPVRGGALPSTQDSSGVRGWRGEPCPKRPALQTSSAPSRVPWGLSPASVRVCSLKDRS